VRTQRKAPGRRAVTGREQGDTQSSMLAMGEASAVIQGQIGPGREEKPAAGKASIGQAAREWLSPFGLAVLAAEAPSCAHHCTMITAT
jgi:hypothetical protein